MTLFTDLYTQIDGLLMGYYMTTGLKISSSLGYGVIALSTILVIFSGISLMLGWTSTPAKKLLIAVFTIVLVVNVATQFGVYSDLVGSHLRNFPNQMIELTTSYSAANPGELLDRFSVSILSGADKVKASSVGNFVASIYASALAVFMIFIYCCFVGAAGSLLFMAYIAVTLLASIGPILICTLLFSATRDWFSKWLTYSITFGLLAGLVGAMLGLVDNIANAHFTSFDETAGDLDIYKFIAPILIMIMSIPFFVVIYMMAGSLGGGIMQGGAAAGSLVKSALEPIANRTVGERWNARTHARQRELNSKAITNRREKRKAKDAGAGLPTK